MVREGSLCPGVHGERLGQGGRLRSASLGETLSHRGAERDGRDDHALFEHSEGKELRMARSPWSGWQIRRWWWPDDLGPSV